MPQNKNPTNSKLDIFSQVDYTKVDEVVVSVDSSLSINKFNKH